MTAVDLITETETARQGRVRVTWLPPGTPGGSPDGGEGTAPELLRFEFQGRTAGRWLPALIATCRTRVAASAGPYVREALLEVLLSRGAPAIEAGLDAFEAEYAPDERGHELEFYPASQRVFEELAAVDETSAPAAARRCDALAKLHATLPAITSDWLAVDEPPERYVLIERSLPRYGSEHYITTHRSPADAFKANADQECAADWLPAELVDLDLDLSWPLERTVAWEVTDGASTATVVYGVAYVTRAPRRADYDRVRP